MDSTIVIKAIQQTIQSVFSLVSFFQGPEMLYSYRPSQNMLHMLRYGTTSECYCTSVGCHCTKNTVKMPLSYCILPLTSLS
jgi:hypothetical protein